MNWIKFQDISQIDEIKKQSNEKPVLVFKHSIRCSISSTVLNRLERNWKSEEIKPYYLDLINFRNISNQISQEFKIEHQSPQALIIHKGECVFNASHMDINYAELINETAKY